MSGHFVKEGINNYSPTTSSVGLCKYLTLREKDYTDQKHGTIAFKEQYKYEKALYRFEYNYSTHEQKETVLLIFTYSKEVYSEVTKSIISEPGFSDEISFKYGDFTFYLNKTEKLAAIENAKKDGHPESAESRTMTDYCFKDGESYLHWIQLVGYSDSRQEIAFIGFYYARFKGFFVQEAGYYCFLGWDEFFYSEFSFYDWN